MVAGSDSVAVELGADSVGVCASVGVCGDDVGVDGGGTSFGCGCV